jgi:hypothetical protein
MTSRPAVSPGQVGESHIVAGRGSLRHVSVGCLIGKDDENSAPSGFSELSRSSGTSERAETPMRRQQDDLEARD